MQNPIKVGNFSSLSYQQNYPNLPENRHWRNNYFCTVFCCSPESHCAYWICKMNFGKQVSLYRYQRRPWRIFQKKKCIKSLLTSELILTAWYFREERKKQFSFLTTPPRNISCTYFKIPSPRHDICLRSNNHHKHFNIFFSSYNTSWISCKFNSDVKAPETHEKTDQDRWPWLHTKDSQGKK